LKRLVMNLSAFVIGLGLVFALNLFLEARAQYPSPAPTPASNEDPGMMYIINPQNQPIPISVTGGTSSVYVPIVQDAAWLPAWQKLAYILMKIGGVFVCLAFLGKVV